MFCVTHFIYYFISIIVIPVVSLFFVLFCWTFLMSTPGILPFTLDFLSHPTAGSRSIMWVAVCSWAARWASATTLHFSALSQLLGTLNEVVSEGVIHLYIFTGSEYLCQSAISRYKRGHRISLRISEMVLDETLFSKWSLNPSLSLIAVSVEALCKYFYCLCYVKKVIVQNWGNLPMGNRDLFTVGCFWVCVFFSCLVYWIFLTLSHRSYSKARRSLSMSLS